MTEIPIPTKLRDKEGQREKCPSCGCEHFVQGGPATWPEVRCAECNRFIRDIDS